MKSFQYVEWKWLWFLVLASFAAGYRKPTHVTQESMATTHPGIAYAIRSDGKKLQWHQALTHVMWIKQTVWDVSSVYQETHTFYFRLTLQCLVRKLIRCVFILHYINMTIQIIGLHLSLSFFQSDSSEVWNGELLICSQRRILCSI